MKTAKQYGEWLENHGTIELIEKDFFSFLSSQIDNGILSGLYKNALINKLPDLSINIIMKDMREKLEEFGWDLKSLKQYDQTIAYRIGYR